MLHLLGSSTAAAPSVLPFTHSFSAGAGPFTLAGGASIVANNLLIKEGETAIASLGGTVDRGIYIEFSILLLGDYPAAGGWLHTNATTTPAGYAAALFYDIDSGNTICDSYEDVTAKTSNVVAGSGSFVTLRLEIPAVGAIVLKRNGTTVASFSDATYTSFSRVLFKGFPGWTDSAAIASVTVDYL